MMGLLLGTGGDSGKLVLPAMMQDDWGTGEPCIMTPGEDRGIRLLLCMAPEPPVPWKPQGVLRTNPSVLPRASVRGDREPSPKACKGGLSMPRCPPLTSLWRENAGKTSGCGGPHGSGEKLPLPRCHHRLEWGSYILAGPRGFCSVLLEAVR